MFVFSILSLGHLLISDLGVINLLMYSLPSMILLYLATPFYTEGVLDDIIFYCLQAQNDKSETCGQLLVNPKQVSSWSWAVLYMCMYVCMYPYMYVMYVCTYIHVCVCIIVCMCACVWIYLYALYKVICVLYFQDTTMLHQEKKYFPTLFV